MYTLVEQAECVQKRNIYKQRRPRKDAAKCGVSSGSALFVKINTFLVMVDFKIVYDQAFIHFVLIGDRSSKGDTNITKNSVKIGFREINIGSTHKFCTHNIRNPSEL